jgi:hypothetical protein
MPEAAPVTSATLLVMFSPLSGRLMAYFTDELVHDDA